MGKGATINMHGRTAVDAAIDYNDAEALQLFLEEAGALLDYEDLICMVRCRPSLLVHVMPQHLSLDIDPHELSICLRPSGCRGSIHAVRLLLQAGAPVDKADVERLQVLAAHGTQDSKLLALVQQQRVIG
jgi:hypothetical protein